MAADPLDPENLKRLAKDAVHQAGLRFHEIPAKDLPDVATTLLHLADYMESTRAPKEEVPSNRESILAEVNLRIAAALKQISPQAEGNTADTTSKPDTKPKKP